MPISLELVHKIIVSITDIHLYTKFRAQDLVSDIGKH